MALKKKDIVDMIYSSTGIPQKDCIKILESVLEIIKDELAK